MSLTSGITPLCEPPTTCGIRWSMLISHHPPCDYDRTFKIGTVRICTRCFGVLLGVLASILPRIYSHILASTIPAWVSLLLPLPAVIDFTANELEWWRSNNVKRMVSGLLLGSYVGVSGYNIFDRCAFFGCLGIAWLAILEFGVALTLRRCGRLDNYVERYEKAVRKSSGEFIT